MEYFNLPVILRCAIQFLMIVIMSCSVYTALNFFFQRQKAGYTLSAVLLGAAECVFMRLSGETADRVSQLSPLIASLRARTVFVLIALQAVGTALLFAHCKRWEKTHLSDMSVKEITDRFPAGICYYSAKSGITILVNMKMHELCERMTGHRLLDPAEFCREYADRTPLAAFDDGSSYLFKKKEVLLGKHRVVELTAVDVSDEHRLTQMLEEENERLLRVKESLGLFRKTIDGVVREREILETKARIHNDIDALLLASEYVITHPTDLEGRRELLKKWRTAALSERNGTLRDDPDSLEDISRAAQAIGMRIVFQGKISDRLRDSHGELLENIVHEALTNAYSHAGATELTVSVSEDRDGFVIRCTNNGDPPRRDAAEGGGLTSLRNKVEAVGGTMQVHTSGQFCLEIRIGRRAQ